MLTKPESFGERVCRTLEREHGKDYWRELVRNEGQAWLEIGATDSDVYDGRLSLLRVPTLIVHGALDPRTEPGELEAVRRELPHARMHILPSGRHSPHSAASVAGECSRVVRDFLQPLSASRKR
jgi:valacyclovir hydrolase